MKLQALFILTFCVAAFMGCIDEHGVKPPSPVNKATVSVDWNTTFQTIEGFGVFAGRAIPWFESAGRDTVIERLFDRSGLNLTFLRGEILESYAVDASGIPVLLPPGTSINMDPNGTAFRSLTEAQRNQVSQLWILKTVQERYSLPNLIASAYGLLRYI